MTSFQIKEKWGEVLLTSGPILQSGLLPPEPAIKSLLPHCASGAAPLCEHRPLSSERRCPSPLSAAIPLRLIAVPCRHPLLPRSAQLSHNMTSRLWRMYADHLYHKWEKTVLWDMVEPYRRPRSFTPLVSVYVAAFYTGVVGSALTEQLYKEKYWEEHPGEAVPLMRPKFYWGPWKVNRGDVLPPNQ